LPVNRNWLRIAYKEEHPMQRKSVLMAAVIGSILAINIPSFGNLVERKSPIMLNDKVNGVPVAIDQLPKSVVDAVKKDLPGAHLSKAYKLVDGNYFLTDVKVGKKEYNVTATPEGKILKREEDND
jgi:hypothetical protein